MTNFGKGKRLITTLISVLLCILTAFSVLGVNLKLKNNQEKETTQTQAATTNLDSEIWGEFNKYDYPNGPSYDVDASEHENLDSLNTDYDYWYYDQLRERYASKKYFHIYGWTGLRHLKDLMNTYDCCFEGKSIYIWNDIKPPEEGYNYWIPVGSQCIEANGSLQLSDYPKMFKGKFYGNGCTLSGFTTYFNGIADGFENVEPNYGIFAYLKNAAVYNLKVKDFTCIDWKTRTEWLYGGAIAGRAESSIIKNCIVENYTFKLRAKPNDDLFGNKYAYSYIGGIVGEAANTTIEDCLVDRITLYIDKNEGNDETYESNFCSFGPAKSFNGGNTLRRLCVRDRWKIVEENDESWSQNGPVGYNDYAENINAYEIYEDLEYHDNSVTDVSNVARQYLNGKSFASAWHAPTDGVKYNNMPYLRSWLTFKYYTFQSGEHGTLVAPNNLNGADVASINSSLKVEVPTDDKSFSFKPSSDSQSVYGVTVIARPVFGWKCVGWKDMGNYTYEAVYERTHANITFKSLLIQDGTQTHYWAPYLLNGDYELEDCKGLENDIVLCVEVNSKVNIQVVNSTIVCLVTYPSGSARIIKYDLSTSKIFTEEDPTPSQTRINNLWNMYCPDKSSVENYESSKNFKVVEDITIQPTLKLKEYGVGVG